MTIENKILIFLSFLIVFVFTDWILRTIRSIEGVAGQRRRSLRRRVSVDGRRGRSAVSRHLSPMKLDLNTVKAINLSAHLEETMPFFDKHFCKSIEFLSGILAGKWCDKKGLQSQFDKPAM